MTNCNFGISNAQQLIVICSVSDAYDLHNVQLFAASLLYQSCAAPIRYSISHTTYFQVTSSPFPQLAVTSTHFVLSYECISCKERRSSKVRIITTQRWMARNSPQVLHH